MKTTWYKGIQFRASSGKGLEQKMPDGAWKVIKPIPQQKPHKLNWFKMKLNP